MTFLDRSSLVDTGKTPKEGDLIFGSDSYFGQITGVSDNLVEFTIVGRIENLNEIIDGKKYKVVASVIRNSGSGWELVENSAHTNINVASVSNNTAVITITYNFTANKVVSFVATPDEKMAFDNIFMGASVGLNESTIEMYQHKSIGGYVSWNGSAWVFAGSSDQNLSATFSGGVLTITHPSISGIKGNVSCRDGIYIVNLGGLGDTTTPIYIRDYSGNLITTPDTSMRIYFERSSRNVRLNPSNYIDASANIWFYGVFEVE